MTNAKKYAHPLIQTQTTLMVMHNGEKSKFSKSSGKSAGVGRHFICHRYWRGIKPRPTRNKPGLIEMLEALVSGLLTKASLQFLEQSIWRKDT
ncbi:MAG: hypothetical protein L6406_02435, partial [Desulfobacterales bacterium]|nr:hypothetical protein [Desulfobacterales bacterium]